MVNMHKDDEGRNFVDWPEIKRYNCVVFVFDLQLVEKAKKAFEEGIHLNGMYTFGDPQKIAIKEGVYEVCCTDGTEKLAFAIGFHEWTYDEVIEFKNSIGYKHLGIVIRKI